MDSDEDRLREETKAKLRAAWMKPGGPEKVMRLLQLEAKKRAAERAEANRMVLAAVLRQALRIQTLTKLTILKARAPAKYERLTRLLAKMRGTTKPTRD